MTKANAWLLCFCLFSSGCSGGGPEPAATAGANTSFTLPATGGGQVSLPDYAGRPVLLFFFSEDCRYCRQAAPFVRKMSEKYGAKGLAVLAICAEEAEGAAGKFAAEFGFNFPVAYRGGAVSRAYRNAGYPYLYLLDSKQRVYDTWGGYAPEYDAQIIAGAETLMAAGAK